MPYSLFFYFWQLLIAFPMWYREHLKRAFPWEPCLMQHIMIHQLCVSQTFYHDPTVTKQDSEPHNLFMSNWVSCPSIVPQGLILSLKMSHIWHSPGYYSYSGLLDNINDERLQRVVFILQQPTTWLITCLLNVIKLIGFITLNSIINKQLSSQIVALFIHMPNRTFQANISMSEWNRGSKSAFLSAIQEMPLMQLLTK